jgi:hypothetical protein
LPRGSRRRLLSRRRGGTAQGHYPLKPFVAFRLPTHAVAYAAAGELLMMLVIRAMCVALMFAWCLPPLLLGFSMP